MVKRHCCVCLSKNHQLIYERDFLDIKGVQKGIYHQRIELCMDCGFAFANPGLSEQELKTYYEYISLYENYGIGFHNSRFTNMSKRQFNFISEFLTKKHKKVLDVGCATGFNLVPFKEKGYQVVGLEASDTCVVQGKKHFGIKIINDFFPSKKIKGKLDLIILSHVVEHVAKPKEFVKAAYDSLSENGLLFVEVPDSYSYIKLPGNQFTFEHINHFTTDTLIYLMEEAGFNLLKLTIVNDYINMPGTPALSTVWEKNKYPVKNSGQKKKNPSGVKMFQSYVGKIKEEEQYIKNQIKSLKKKVGKKKIALWGAGTTASSWMPFLNENLLEVAYVFDIDPKKDNTLFNGIPVKKYDPKYLAEIEGILIASISEQKYIYDDLVNKLKVKNVYKFV